VVFSVFSESTLSTKNRSFSNRFAFLLVPRSWPLRFCLTNGSFFRGLALLVVVAVTVVALSSSPLSSSPPPSSSPPSASSSSSSPWRTRSPCEHRSHQHERVGPRQRHTDSRPMPDPLPVACDHTFGLWQLEHAVRPAWPNMSGCRAPRRAESSRWQLPQVGEITEKFPFRCSRSTRSCGARRSGCSRRGCDRTARRERPLRVALTTARRQAVRVDVVLAMAVDAQVAGAGERAVVAVAALARDVVVRALEGEVPTSWSGLMSSHVRVEWHCSHAVPYWPLWTAGSG